MEVSLDAFNGIPGSVLLGVYWEFRLMDSYRGHS